MTDEQSAQIEALRMQGKGYKAVASAVGLSRDIVRNYCRAKGMEGHGETVALNVQRRFADRVDSKKASRMDAGRPDA